MQAPGPEADTPKTAHEVLCAEIRRLRGDLSQEALGKLTGYTRAYMSMAENPFRQLQSREVIHAIDVALGAGGRLDALRVDAKREQDELRWKKRQVRELPQLGSEAARQSMPESSPIDSIEETMSSAADESTQFLEWMESSNVGDLTVEQMQSEVHRIVRNYLKRPTMPLFLRTKALRNRAFDLLKGHPDPRQSRELYATAGWALTALAWISVDLGHPEEAEDHARAAWGCAQRADYNLLRAWVRATQHTAAFWQSDYEAAAEWAADGLRYAGTGTAELYLASALAMDLARAGDTGRAAVALVEAQRKAETVTRVEGELLGPFTCPVDRAGSLWATTQLAIGDTQAALEYANRSVALFESAPGDRRNLGSERMARLLQVEAHIIRGDLEGPTMR